MALQKQTSPLYLLTEEIVDTNRDYQPKPPDFEIGCSPLNNTEYGRSDRDHNTLAVVIFKSPISSSCGHPPSPDSTLCTAPLYKHHPLYKHLPSYKHCGPANTPHPKNTAHTIRIARPIDLQQQTSSSLHTFPAKYIFPTPSTSTLYRHPLLSNTAHPIDI